eukprot:TRINITY_DN2170_c0_g1_i1.p5 TRINITY_DN2170_c0_g1~~TRINITY_DN2170_c0_g1_i1.p5  ORF type:complete len:109 (-),score=8.50 TRINITY_DN2170_c0_g1_i1:359-685(-)
MGNLQTISEQIPINPSAQAVLLCNNCGCSYGAVGWGDWIQPGTTACNKGGYCGNHGGNWHNTDGNGNRVQLLCGACGTVYDSVDWPEWASPGTTYRKHGLCERCYRGS